MSPGEIIPTFLSFGLAGMFAISFLEKFIPVAPSYVLFMLLGMTAASQSGLLALLVVTIAGSLAGSLGWYGLGRWLGEQRVEAAVARYGKYIFFKLPTYHRLAASYRGNRFVVTMLGQTVPVARVYLGLPAGVLRLPLASFSAAAALGILPWNLTFLTLGFVLQGSSQSPTTVGLWASAVLIATEFALFFLVRSVRQRRARTTA
jgi:alkaline phosphatase